MRGVKAKAIKKQYNAVVYFEVNAEMENVKVLSMIHNLKRIANVIDFYPNDIDENGASADIIKNEGFKIRFTSECELEELASFFIGQFNYEYEQQKDNG